MGRDRARSVGRPGGSARSAYRLQRARFAQMPWGARLLVLALVTAAGGVLALVAGFNPLIGAALAAGATAAIAALLVAPDLLAVLLAFFGFTTFALPLGALYAGATLSWQNSPAVGIGDVLGYACLLVAAALACIPVAVRFSRGAAWLTLVLAYAAVPLVGVPLLLALPWMGLFAAYVSMVAVLLFRCGGWTWISGSVVVAVGRLADLWSRVRQGHPARDARPATGDDVKMVSAWLVRADAEKQTADLLDEGLPAGFTVFHDLRVKGDPSSLGHLVVGPSGGFLIASVSSDGAMSEDPQQGLVLPGIPLDRVAGTLLDQRRLVARRLRCMERDLGLLIVVHGDQSRGERRSIAVFDPRDVAVPLGQVILVGEEGLLSEVNPGYGLWGRLKVAQVAHRARMRLSSALAPAPVRATDTPSPIPLLSPVDEDGNATLIASSAVPIPAWLVDGVRVSIATNGGVLTGLRAVGEPFSDGQGCLMVLVCVEEEWSSAQAAGRPPRAHPYPVRSMGPSD